MSTNVRPDQESTGIQSAFESMVDSIYRDLGTDVRGYEVRYYFAADQVRIVDPEADDVVDETDLDGASIHQYREWVDEHVDATEVDWNEEAF
jgi:hypothetical protein